MPSPDAELPPIPEEELGRLIRILGMLGSSSAGERAAAALKASEWVKAHQTDWQTLLLPPIANPVVAVVVGDPEPPQKPVQTSPSPYAPNFTAAMQAAMAQQAAAQNPYTGGLSGLGGAAYAHVGPFTATGQQATWQQAAASVLAVNQHVLKGPKEEDFVKSLLLRGWPKLTDKQADWLRDICGRAGLSW